MLAVQVSSVLVISFSFPQLITVLHDSGKGKNEIQSHSSLVHAFSFNRFSNRSIHSLKR